MMLDLRVVLVTLLLLVIVTFFLVSRVLVFTVLASSSSSFSIISSNVEVFLFVLLFFFIYNFAQVFFSKILNFPWSFVLILFLVIFESRWTSSLEIQTKFFCLFHCNFIIIVRFAILFWLFLILLSLRFEFLQLIVKCSFFVAVLFEHGFFFLQVNH